MFPFKFTGAAADQVTVNEWAVVRTMETLVGGGAA